MSRIFPTTGATIIDSDIDLPTPSSQYEGVLMFQKDTNELKICDGNRWAGAYKMSVPIGFQLMPPSSVTNGTLSKGVVSYNNNNPTKCIINGVFSPSVRNYRIILNTATSTSAGLDINFQFTSNGALDASNAYYLQKLEAFPNSVSANAISVATKGLFGWATNVTGVYYNLCVVELSGVSIGSYTYWMAQTAVGYSSDLTTHGTTIASWTGHHATTSAYDGFAIYTDSAGTNLNGQVRVYGYKDSLV